MEKCQKVHASSDDVQPEVLSLTSRAANGQEMSGRCFQLAVGWLVCLLELHAFWLVRRDIAPLLLSCD